MTSRRSRLPVHLSPRPCAAMAHRFAIACEVVVFWLTFVAKVVVAAAAIAALSIAPPA